MNALFNLKQKVGLANRTVDPRFEEIRNKLKVYTNDVEHLTEAIHKQLMAFQDIGKFAKVTNDASNNIYKALPGVQLSQVDNFPAVVVTVEQSFTTAYARMEAVAKEVSEHYKFLQFQKKRMEERDKVLSECDKIAYNLKGAREKNDQVKIAEFDSRYATTHAHYETLSATITEEINNAYEHRRDFLEPKLLAFVQIYRELAMRMGQPFGGNFAAQPAHSPQPYYPAAQARPCAPQMQQRPPPPQQPNYPPQPQPNYPQPQPNYPPQPQHNYPPQPQPNYPPQAPSYPPKHAITNNPFGADDAPPPPPAHHPSPQSSPPPQQQQFYGQQPDTPFFGQQPQLPPKPPAHRPPPSAPAQDGFGQNPFCGGDWSQEQIEASAGKAAGDYVAGAALNEQNQQRAGQAVADYASNEEAQARMGNALASRTNNSFLKSAASSSKVQHGAGRLMGSLATNKTVQNRVGQTVAEQAQNEENQKRMISGVKQGASSAYSGAKQGAASGAAWGQQQYAQQQQQPQQGWQ
eukprot:TRINITY_DN1480_c0_g1_i1.p1 TRINITY_DN1480_c0_g1~~TRINITY_DN1480_c0_g1_i1.p1  ORF type:complete len:519 (-),score=159.72 TRINITY_DN1480_c0_g1_i1:76-1632(-)